jgi:hypothetical protein
MNEQNINENKKDEDVKKCIRKATQTPRRRRETKSIIDHHHYHHNSFRIFWRIYHLQYSTLRIHQINHKHTHKKEKQQ